MPYMNCPRCGLSIRLRAPYLLLERCPRCIARARDVVPMQLSDRSITRAQQVMRRTTPLARDAPQLTR